MSNNVKRNIPPVKKTVKRKNNVRRKKMPVKSNPAMDAARKEMNQRRLIFLIAAAVFLIGAAMALNRNSNSSKYIGTVYVIAGNNSSELKGYKIQKQYEDKITEYDAKPLSEIKSSSIPSFDHDASADTAVSFTGNYRIGDALYSVYDMNFEPVYSDRTSLSIPTKNEDGYIVSIDVKWGRLKNNVTMRYYFQIDP